MADNSAFISYRRGDGYPWARLIWEELESRSINVFLDLESMRQAGRFDERILNQIAARPYFLMVLAEGSLDRCSSESDWVRREIEHAIDTDRIIVPLFIAPFEPGQFPNDLPPRIAEALANSNGVTFYSQFLAAALDQLADFLQPVDLPTVDLSDDDAEYEEDAINRVRSEPAPSLPPPVVDRPDDPEARGREAGGAPPPPPPPSGGRGPTTPDAIEPSDAPATDAIEPPTSVGQVPVDERGDDRETDAIEAHEVTGQVPVDERGDDRETDAIEAPEVTGQVPVDERGDDRETDAGGGSRAQPPRADLDGTESRPPARTSGTAEPGGDSSRSVPGPATAGAPRDVSQDPGHRGRRRRRRLLVVLGLVVLVAAGALGAWYVIGGGQSSTLSSDEWLEAGDSIVDGDAELTMLANGRLDLTYEGESLDWLFDGPLRPGAAAVFQRDGNFVVYPFKSDVEGLIRNDALWATSTQGRGGTELRIVDTGSTAVLEINRDDGSTVRELEGRP